MTEPRQLAVVRTWRQLHEALRARSDELGWKRETLDQLANVGDGHFSKLLAPVPLKNLGPRSFEAVLGTLGLKLIVVEDTALVEAMRRRASQHNISMTRDHAKAKSGACRANRRRAKDKGGNPLLRNPDTAREFNRAMAMRRWAKSSAAQRRRAIAKANKARIAKRRRARRARSRKT